MPYFLRIMLAAVLVSSTGVHPAFAQLAPYENDVTNQTPLIVIRFNEPHVMYDKPLYNTISRALQVKPSAMFDVVSVAPRAHEASNQSHYNQVAAQNTQRIMNTLSQMGLPQSRITLTNQIDDVDASEVRIFVH